MTTEDLLAEIVALREALAEGRTDADLAIMLAQVTRERNEANARADALEERLAFATDPTQAPNPVTAGACGMCGGGAWIGCFSWCPDK